MLTGLEPDSSSVNDDGDFGGTDLDLSILDWMLDSRIDSTSKDSSAGLPMFFSDISVLLSLSLSSEVSSYDL